MKRIFILTLAIMLLLSSCGTSESESGQESAEAKSSATELSELVSAETESSEAESSDAESTPDTVPPTIRLTPNTAEVTINKGEDYDLLQGVVGDDAVDGTITDKIQIDKGGFDPDTPGEYTVTYTLKDAAGNEAKPKTRKITVVDNQTLDAPAIYDGEIPGEKLNPEAHPVFGGAWYHKVVSSKDKWVGIEGTVTLPEVKIARYKADYDESLDFDPNVKNLDNPSVYLGGNAYSESDVGLSFSLGVIDTKTKKISTGSIVFRPFWRYITKEDQDLGGYDAHGGKYSVSANGNNCFANYHWSYTEYYYLPGDTLRIIVTSPEPDKLQMQIRVIEKSTLPQSIEMREKYGWKDPEDFISPIFSSPGHGKGVNAEFKRVNAIDQSGNEGGTAIETKTEIKNAIWHSTYLYREIDGTLYRVPMNEQRRAVTDAPDSEHITSVTDDTLSPIGGETVTIHPGYEN